MAKRWTEQEIDAALNFIRGGSASPPTGRTVGALRQKFPDEMSHLVIEAWMQVPARERHRLTLSVAQAGLNESFALGEKNTAQKLVDRFTHSILPGAILRGERYPEDGDQWAADVRRAMFAAARVRLPA